MRNRLHSLLALIAALVAAAACGITAANPRTTYDFNPGWRLFVGDPTGAERVDFDDALWKPVTLPRAWNEDAAFRVSIEQLPTGVAWYRKRFTLPATDLGKKLYLEFEGVRHTADVYLNGQLVGRHDNGVMAFGIDVTALARPGDGANVIAVRVDNSWNVRERSTDTPFQWSDRNFYANYGGINKNVRLHVADRLHQTLPLYSNLGTTGVYVYATDHDVPGKAATITAESQVRNDHDGPRTFTYEVVLSDPAGGELKRFAADAPVTVGPGQTTTVKASARVGGLEFWSWGYGRLYDVTTRLVVDGKPADAVATRTGFRKTEFRDGVVKLNDRVIHLKGYAQRTTNEWPALGTDVPPWLADFSNGLMVASNGNLVRWMHVTPSKQDVESCDRVGLMQALPAGDSERDPGPGRRWDMRVELMRDAIIYNRNNPSVIFYEGGNAGIADERMARLIALRDEFDPHGGRAMGCRNMLGSAVAEWGGDMLYVNKSAAKPLWATEYMRDEAPRKHMDEHTPPFHKDGDGPPHKGETAASYNRNQDSMAAETVRRWFDYWRERPGTGRRVNAGGVNIIFSDSNTHHRGAENYRRSGEVDAMRLPKEGFFAHKVMWDGWVDVERPAAHIVGHWNYQLGTTKDMLVVSSADNVELFRNGGSLGFGTRSSSFLFTFKDVGFEPGTLKAVGHDAAGKPVCTAEVRTAGRPVAVKLTPHTSPTGFRADGSDVALIDIEVVDGYGQRCPTAMDTLTFALDGPAEWRGGIAQGPDNYILSKSLPVELGVNRVLVRSTTEAGTITLRAESPGLQPASVTLTTLPAPAPGGLALSQPPPAPSLDRGPTPAGRPPFSITRTPLDVARVTAGAKADTAALTVDDNETTSWSNDGKLATAWVEYELDSPATASEVVLKLGSWRTKSYPLRVTVDGREAYAGRTEPNLGYVTLPLTPAQGRKIRISLTGEARSSAALDLTEVTGRKDIDGNDRASSGRGSLTIVEAEFYGPAVAAPGRGRDTAAKAD